MNILLTGASGFIGQHFIKNLSRDHTITPFSFSKDDPAGINFEGIDAVMHLAALVHQTQTFPETEYFKANRDKTLLLASKAKTAGVKHFVFMSTIKVYGSSTDQIPFTEDSACFPEDAYGKSKLAAEQELRKLGDDAFTVSVIRSPLVYGKGVKANFLNLAKLVKASRLLPLGNIRNKRSIVYVENLISLINSVITQRRSGIYLASDASAVSTTELVRLMAAALHKKIILLPLPDRVVRFIKWANPGIHKRLFQNLELDATRTRKTLHFYPEISTKEGIARTLDCPQ